MLRKISVFLLLTLVLVSSIQSIQKRPKQFRILLAGDVMFDWGLRDTMARYGFTAPIEKLIPFFEESDVKMFNLETPVSAIAKPDPIKPYVFNAKPEELDLLEKLDVSLVFLANNHTMDYGKDGLFETMENLNSRGILFAGAGKNTEDSLVPKKLTFGDNTIRVFSTTAIGESRLYATPTSPGAAAFSVPRLVAARGGKKDSFDILSVHWGIEYNPEPTPQQITDAHKLIDAGFQVVAGHHPHIPQGIEKYNDGLILYSLGNFIFGSRNQYLNHNLSIVLYLESNRLKLCEIVPIFGKFQKSDHIIYPLEGGEANAFLEEIALLSEKLNTRIHIRKGRGYIYF